MSLDERHLLRLSDDVGLLEHARGPIPRREHGYCLDDVARGLLLLSREPRLTPRLERLHEVYLAFVSHAHDHGRFHNRLGYDRRWQDGPALGDWWGRALWALGSTAAHGVRQWWVTEAKALFDEAATRRSPSLHSLVFAGLGAVEVLSRFPQDAVARSLLTDSVAAIGPIPTDPAWPWPRPRLEYAAATLAELLVVAGPLLDRPEVRADGLRVLDWLVELQTRDGHLSVLPVGGWDPHDCPPRFDQQPIEAATLASACVRAHHVTADVRWARPAHLAHAWFSGHNDAGIPLADPTTGGCADGLLSDAVSRNQGAESILALLSTEQLTRLYPLAFRAGLGTLRV